MGTTLTGTTPQDTYDSLIKVTDNGPLSATAKYLSDGLGNDSVLALSTSRVGIGTASPATSLHVSDAASTTATFNSTFGQLSISLLNNGSTFAQIGSGVAVTPSATATDLGFGTAGGASTNIVFATGASFTERMRITSAGDAQFGDGNNFNPVIQYAGSGRVAASPAYSFRGDLDTGMFNPNTGNTIAFATAATERMRIDASGNVGIGTSTPSAKLDVNGNSVLSGAYHYQGAGTYRKQFIQGSVTAAASGTAKKIFTSGYTAVAQIYVIARQDVSNLATTSCAFANAYGGASVTTLEDALLGNVTAISVTYNNAGPYTIEVTLTYSGAAPTIHFYAEGMGDDSFIL
jgi:hypothetical protein